METDPLIVRYSLRDAVNRRHDMQMAKKKRGVPNFKQRRRVHRLTHSDYNYFIVYLQITNIRSYTCQLVMMVRSLIHVIYREFLCGVYMCAKISNLWRFHSSVVHIVLAFREIDFWARTSPPPPFLRITEPQTNKLN